MNIEHFGFLSWFEGSAPKAMSKTARGCHASQSGMQQRLAILPWRFEPGLNARPILIDLAGRRRRFLPPDQLSERKRIRFG
jgi:hypothetical protein